MLWSWGCIKTLHFNQKQQHRLAANGQRLSQQHLCPRKNNHQQNCLDTVMDWINNVKLVHWFLLKTSLSVHVVCLLSRIGYLTFLIGLIDPLLSIEIKWFPFEMKRTFMRLLLGISVNRTGVSVVLHKTGIWMMKVCSSLSVWYSFMAMTCEFYCNQQRTWKILFKYDFIPGYCSDSWLLHMNRRKQLISLKLCNIICHTATDTTQTPVNVHHNQIWWQYVSCLITVQTLI